MDYLQISVFLERATDNLAELLVETADMTDPRVRAKKIIEALKMTIVLRK